MKKSYSLLGLALISSSAMAGISTTEISYLCKTNFYGFSQGWKLMDTSDAFRVTSDTISPALQIRSVGGKGYFYSLQIMNTGFQDDPAGEIEFLLRTAEGSTDATIDEATQAINHSKFEQHFSVREANGSIIAPASFRMSTTGSDGNANSFNVVCDQISSLEPHSVLVANDIVSSVEEMGAQRANARSSIFEMNDRKRASVSKIEIAAFEQNINEMKKIFDQPLYPINKVIAMSHTQFEASWGPSKTTLSSILAANLGALSATNTQLAADLATEITKARNANPTVVVTMLPDNAENNLPKTSGYTLLVLEDVSQYSGKQVEVSERATLDKLDDGVATDYVVIEALKKLYPKQKSAKAFRQLSGCMLAPSFSSLCVSDALVELKKNE